MKSWKTSLGGALSATGTVLMGVGILPQLSGEPSKLLMGIAMAGFVLNALGTFFAHLFAADQTAVINAISSQQKDNTEFIKRQPVVQDSLTTQPQPIK